MFCLRHEHTGNTIVVQERERLHSTQQSHKRNNVRMLRNMKEALLHMTNYEVASHMHYDYVIRARSDNYYMDDVQFINLLPEEVMPHRV